MILPKQFFAGVFGDFDEFIVGIDDLAGHIGDGNLHINYVAPKDLERAKFKQISASVEREIFSLLPKYQGSISAEHGIGLVKKADLSLTRSKSEVGFMKQIKKVFDPNGIMNPGKIFDL